MMHASANLSSFDRGGPASGEHREPARLGSRFARAWLSRLALLRRELREDAPDDDALNWLRRIQIRICEFMIKRYGDREDLDAYQEPPPAPPRGTVIDDSIAPTEAHMPRRGAELARSIAELSQANTPVRIQRLRVWRRELEADLRHVFPTRLKHGISIIAQQSITAEFILGPTRWDLLPPPRVLPAIGSARKFTDAGFRYFLPALLRGAMVAPQADLVDTLLAEVLRRQDRLELSPRQWFAVLECAQFLVSALDDPAGFEQRDSMLKRFEGCAAAAMPDSPWLSDREDMPDRPAV